MAAVKHKKVVTAFIKNQGKILVLRRSKKVGSYRGKWAGVSGYLEESSPLAQAMKEIYEEIGLTESEVFLVSAGKPFTVLDRDIGVCWQVHPFLFETPVPEKIQLDWEHVEMKWVDPVALQKLPAVPKLAETYERCLSDSEVVDTTC